MSDREQEPVRAERDGRKWRCAVCGKGGYDEKEDVLIHYNAYHQIHPAAMTDEQERVRLEWTDWIVCPHCGSTEVETWFTTRSSFSVVEFVCEDCGERAEELR